MPTFTKCNGPLHFVNVGVSNLFHETPVSSLVKLYSPGQREYSAVNVSTMI